MRDFVRNILPQVRSRSPQPLNARAELELEQEIENENATVVGGDGVETKTGMEGVKDELGAGEDSSDADSSDEKPGGRKGYNSWGRSRKWSLVSSFPSPQDELQERELERKKKQGKAATPTNGPISTPHPPPATSQSDAATSQLASGLRRIRSAVSLVVPVPSLVARSHHCKPSPFESRRTGPEHLRVSSINPMPKVTSPLPSPSLRRSTISHPDIASLVENWSHSGPANQTLLYKTATDYTL